MEGSPDIVLPGPLNGFDIARHIRAKSPSLPVIFSSGYNRALHPDGVNLEEDAVYLMKPYRQLELSALVSKMLAARCLRAVADRGIKVLR